MFLSAFDVFKVGIGPSSSHTMGPMAAAAAFLALLREGGDGQAPPEARLRIRVSLHGSLAFTGKGHATDRAVMLGLLGHRAADLDIDRAEADLVALRDSRRLPSDGGPVLAFDPDDDIVFDHGPPLPGHPNGMEFQALAADGTACLSRIYYSIGGGFIVTAEQIADGAGGEAGDPDSRYPFPFDNAASMLRLARESGNSIAGMMRANECVVRAGAEVDAGLAALWDAMSACIDRGLSRQGELPGGLRVKRRAGALFEQLSREQGSNSAQPHVFSDWLTVYAMAVNEENAGGGRVVTAPTNGAAGVVPAVLRYYLDHCIGADEGRVGEFLLTAAAIGGLIKSNASISGADAGCQAEVGSAAAMAAAGPLRGSRRHARAGGERRRDRAGAPSRHDLRPGRRPRPGAVHRAQRHRRDQGRGRRIAGAARRRHPLHAARQLHRSHARDRPGDEPRSSRRPVKAASP